MARGERPRTGEGTEEKRHPGGVVKSNDIKYLTERAGISSETTRACGTRESTRHQLCSYFTIIVSVFFSCADIIVALIWHSIAWTIILLVDRERAYLGLYENDFREISISRDSSRFVILLSTLIWRCFGTTISSYLSLLEL